ncbi:MAG TPA: hypothetical protein VEO01_25065, partial [Pseudonocardiaceae bacterium]|nr:hypothetical protein [Pseudonocardiaceae bacterium]
GSVTGTGTATVTQAFGDFHGVLYADRNHDGTFEPGEGVDGITVTYFRNQDPFLTPTTITSGPDGQFVLTQVPTGAYGFEFSSRSGWVFGSPEGSASLTATVTEAGETASVLLTRPLSDQLHAAIRFDQASYQPGDTVHVTVTLSNSGTTPISGVIADCNRVGDENSLQPGAGWGTLDINGAGATIPAGRTRVFHAAFALPDAAQLWGYVSAFCQFGPEPDQNPRQGYPGVRRRAGGQRTSADPDRSERRQSGDERSRADPELPHAPSGGHRRDRRERRVRAAEPGRQPVSRARVGAVVLQGTVVQLPPSDQPWIIGPAQDVHGRPARLTGPL